MNRPIPKDLLPEDIREFKDNVDRHNLEELKVLVRKYGKDNVFSFGMLRAVAEKSLEMTSYLLSLGDDPNQFDKYDWLNSFPLLNATQGGNCDIIQVLYDYGANLNLEYPDDSQRRAVSWCVGPNYHFTYNHYEVLKKLLSLGAEVNFQYYPYGKEYHCCSPLGETLNAKETAIKRKDRSERIKDLEEIIELLKEYGAEYYFKTYEELNPPKFPPVPKRDRFRGRLKKRGSQPGESGELTVMGLSFIFRWIPPGEFPMGSPETEKRREKDETQHRVKIS